MSLTLQVQVQENESLRQQLGAESRRVSALEARLGALGSPAELSNLLASTQVGGIVILGKVVNG